MKTAILFHILPLVFSSPLLTTPSASSSVTRSALSLFELINARTDQTTNVITSPLSIHLALSMLYSGVQNNSKHQLREVLALENVSEETALEESRNLLLFYSELLNSKLKTKIELANVIFADKTMDINADYKTTLEHNLLTGVIPVDYSDNVGSVETINNWVSNKTHNLIQDLLTPGAIKQDTRLILLNAVYFNANWKLPFEQLITAKSKFYVSKNLSVDVDMMFQENEILFGKDKDLQSQIVSLQYEDPNFTMIIILPDNEDDMEALSKNLQGMDFNRIHNSLHPENILLKMPKFKLGFKTELVSVLKDLGVTDIFDEAVADLSKISNEPLSVSNILHEAKIEVNEEGSEAAAVTGILLDTRSGSETTSLKINRPFLFVIQDLKNNIPLFMGKIVNPTTEDELDQNLIEVRNSFPSELLETTEMDPEERAHIKNFPDYEKMKKCNNQTTENNRILFPCPPMDTQPIEDYKNKHGDPSRLGINGENAALQHGTSI